MVLARSKVYELLSTAMKCLCIDSSHPYVPLNTLVSAEIGDNIAIACLVLGWTSSDQLASLY